MKTKVILIWILAFWCVQEVNAQKEAVHLTWLEFLDDRKSIKGFLIDLQDSSLVILEKKTNAHHTFQIDKVKRISFRDKRSVKKAAIYGGLATALLGGLLPVSYGYDNIGSLIFGSFAFALPGAGIGALLGSSKLHYKIDGLQENYHPEELRAYIINTKNED